MLGPDSGSQASTSFGSRGPTHHPGGLRKGVIALTFDDGPDKRWTPQILDILKARHVPATFFIVGENALTERGLLQRMIAEGHEVGSHTYTHPNLATVDDTRTLFELNTTQRLFQAFTGRTLKLFRAPFFGDAEPTTADEIIPVWAAQQRGYISVGLHVDSEDWQRPGVSEDYRQCPVPGGDPKSQLRRPGRFAMQPQHRADARYRAVIGAKPWRLCRSSSIRSGRGATSSCRFRSSLAFHPVLRCRRCHPSDHAAARVDFAIRISWHLGIDQADCGSSRSTSPCSNRLAAAALAFRAKQKRAGYEIKGSRVAQ